MRNSSFSIITVFCVLWLVVNVPVRAQPEAETTASLEPIIENAGSIETLRSLIVYQDDQVVLEEYLKNDNPDLPRNIKSASKSILSLLVGIAVDEGFIEDINQPISFYFNEHFEAHPDEEKEQITIKNLLTMQAGLETTSFHNYGRWVMSSNWAEFILKQPMEEQRDGKMVYSTGSSHLLSIILTRATGMSTKAFASRYLFQPLDISVDGWDRDPQGYYMGGNNLALTSHDMLKIGQLVLNYGMYGGERIISEQWLDQSFKTYTQSNFNPYDYGFMWWKRSVSDVEVRFAWGFGGQYIFIIPELNAVAVFTNAIQVSDQSRSYREPIFDLLQEHILPYLQNKNPSEG